MGLIADPRSRCSHRDFRIDRRQIDALLDPDLSALKLPSIFEHEPCAAE